MRGTVIQKTAKVSCRCNGVGQMITHGKNLTIGKGKETNKTNTRNFWTESKFKSTTHSYKKTEDLVLC